MNSEPQYCSCPRCTAPLRWQDNQCEVCQWPEPATPGERPQEVFGAVHRMLYRFRGLGLISDQRFQELLNGARSQLVPEGDPQKAAPAKPASEKPDAPKVEPPPELAAQPVEKKPELPVESAPAPELTKPAEPTPAAAPGDPDTATDRAQHYAARRKEAAQQAAAEPAAVVPKKEPRDWGRLMQRFMEQNNILWGELVGGLLIVCCSIALVISFWAEIAERPLLKYGVFNGVSAALFAVGFYTDRRWKIHTTSHGVLITACLLAPLNFLAIASFSKAAAPTELLTLGGEAFSLALFSALIYLAGRIVTPHAPWALAVGVMAPSLLLLLVRRFIDPGASFTTESILATAPVACFAGVATFSLLRTSQPKSIDERPAAQHLVLLGVSLFATLLPLALLLHRSGDIAGVLRTLSPLLVLLGGPLFATAMLFLRRVAEEHTSLRVAASSVGVLGGLMLLASVAFAWPMPAPLVFALLANAAVWTVLARWEQMPRLLLIAAACLAVAWLIGYAASRGEVAWATPDSMTLVGSVFSATAGVRLVGVVALLGGLAVAARQRWPDAVTPLAYATAAAVVASVALLLIFGIGRVGDPEHVTWLLALYAIGLTAAAARLNLRDVSWGAAGLLLLAVVQMVVFRFGAGWWDASAWGNAILLYTTLTTAISVAGALRWQERTTDFLAIFTDAANAASVCAALALVLLAGLFEYQELAIGFLWLALLWLAIGWLCDSAWRFVAFQAAAAASLAMVVAALLSRESWFSESPYIAFDPWFLQAQGIALALLAIFWRGLRMFIGLRSGGGGATAADKPWLQRLPWTTFDRAAASAVFVLTLALAAYAALPGMRQELSPAVEVSERAPIPLSELELPEMPSAHAAGWGGWGLLAATVALVAMGLWDCKPSLRLLGLGLLGAGGCALAAASFVEQTAVASALRWLLGGYALVAAAPVIARRWVRPRLSAIGVELDELPAFFAMSRAAAGRGLVVGLVATLYLVIAVLVAASAIRLDSLPDGAQTMFGWSAALALTAVVGWLGLYLHEQGQTEHGATPATSATWRNLVGLAAIAPLAVVTAYITSVSLTERPLFGPDPASWFGELGNALLYGGPLAMLAAVLLGFAIRERSSQYALSFSLLTTGIATLVYLLELARVGGTLDAEAWLEVAQLNAAVTAICALGWWGAIAWGKGNAAETPRLLVVLTSLSMVFAVEVLLAACWGVFSTPSNLTWQTAAATPAGLVAIALAAVAGWLTTRPRELMLTPHHLGGLGVLAIGVSTAVAAVLDSGDWLGYHTLLVTAALASWAMTWAPVAWRSAAWAMALAALTAVITFRELNAGPSTPGWPAWSLAGLLSVYGVLMSLAWTGVRRWPVWLATPFFLIAGNLWWFEYTPRAWRAFDSFLNTNLIWLSLTAVASIGGEIARARFASRREHPPCRLIGWHRFAVWLGIAGLLLMVVVDLGETGSHSQLLGWSALAAVAAAAMLALWDRHIRWPVAAFYCLGLLAVGKYLGYLDLEGREMFVWAFTMALSAFVLASSYLWHGRRAIAKSAIRLGAPQHLLTKLDSQVWMLTANGLAVVVVLLLVTQIEFSHEAFQQRMTAAYGVLACALALAFLASGRVATTLRYIALAVGACFAVAFGWAWVDPSMPAPGMHRLVAASAALAAVIPIYGMLLVKLWRKENDWTRAAQQTIPTLIVAAGVLLTITLGMEVYSFLDGQAVPLAWPGILAVALALAALTVSSLAAALVPGRDPLNLSERGRTAYVYAAEVFIAVLFLHIRVTMPWLFIGWLLRFWPFIVMVIAFVGVGLSEWFTRRKTTVLSEPLGNTGVLLPLLPVLSYWASAQPGQYAVLLIAVGALYSTLCVMRKSVAFAAVAALAFNGSLWTMLHSVEGLGLLGHPQFWLIPPALCVLVGAQLNRSKMDSETLNAVRYACVLMIYAASTADIFINGVGQVMWMPMALAALSILGVFAGILLRVRAFLYLGVGFLMVALFTVIWHAAEQQESAWPWWVSGIVMGVAIIALFGYFEKKRDAAQALVETLKGWDP